MLRRLAIAICAVVVALTCHTPVALAEPPDSSVQQILVLTRLQAQHFRLDSTYGGDYGNAAERRVQRRFAQRIARAHGLSLADDWPLPLLGLDCFVMDVPKGKAIDDAVREVSHDSRVSFAEPMQTYVTQSAPVAYNDPLLPAQTANSGWRLASLHELSTGRGVRVAVVDSGIEATHPDLAGQLATNQNFVDGSPLVPEHHGTAVAGVIAAKAGNGLGIVGIAPDARLLGLRACWQRQGAEPDTVCNTLSLAKALHYAIDHGAHVINMSLAGPRAELLDRLLTIAIARRIDIVAAFDPALPGGGFPASHRGVVAVANLGTRLPAGVYGAQGEAVLTTQTGGRWNAVSGSSFAAAEVSGLLALVKAKSAGADPAVVLAAARPGGGYINACLALLQITGPCNCSCGRMGQASRARR